jgi:hypothetical protein
MHLKGALHVHTSCSDGELSLAQTLAAHEAMGFDFVALTDHDFLMKKGCYDELGRISTELIVFTGVEMMVFAHGYVHINRIEGEKELLHIFNHPTEMGLPVDKAVARILEVGKSLPLDAVEITTRGFYTPEYDIPQIPFSKVATDDSHGRHMIGRAWVEMDCARNKDAIIRAIKNDDFWNCFAGNGRQS